MYRLPLPLHDPVFALRQQILRQLLLVTAGGATLYLLLGLSPWLGSRLYPWDGLGLLLLSLACFGLIRVPRWGHHLAATIYIAGISQPIFFASQFYGIQHPVNAFYLLGVLACGLLIGDWFVIAWTASYGLFIAFWGYGEWQGQYPMPDPITDLATMVATVAFWWLLLLLTAWLTRFLTRHMEIGQVTARSQSETINRTLAALTATPDVTAMLTEVFGYFTSLLGATQATLWLRQAGEVHPHLLLLDGEVQPAGNLPLPAAHLENWGEIQQGISKKSGAEQIIHLPLQIQSQTVGYISATLPRQHPVPESELLLLERLAQQVTLALRLAELHEQAESNAILQERNRLAREIHDTLAQGFTGIVIQLEAAEDLLPPTAGAAVDHLDRARQLARDSLVEARRSVQALRPLALEQQDLPAALRQMLARITNGSGLKAAFELSGEPIPLPEGVAADLLRIGQEAVTNSLRHSGAGQLTLRLVYRPDTLSLQLEDDGRGLAEQIPPSGHGLTSMRERAARHGGSLQIDQPATGGTLISAQIPLQT